MNHFPKGILLAIVCVIAVCHPYPAASAEDPGLEAIQGRWTVNKTSSEGQPITQKIEIRKDKLTFKVLSAAGELRLFAKGTIKTEKVGAFYVLHVTGLQAGQSEDDLRAVEDDRSSLYRVDDEALTLVSNLDKVRENQKPSLDVYQLEAGSKQPAVPGADQVVGKWKLEVVMGENTREYELHIAESDGHLSGKMVSARSGDHKIKSITLAGSKLGMEIDREYEGSTMTVIYSGIVEDGKLSGTFAVKTRESDLNGKWTAKKP